MRLMGWKARQMVDRYGSSAASERAAEAHKRMARGDRVGVSRSISIAYVGAKSRPTNSEPNL
jgi:hypothetical protein